MYFPIQKKKKVGKTNMVEVENNETYVMQVHIEHRQQCQWVTLNPIGLDRRPHRRLPQYQLR